MAAKVLIAYGSKYGATAEIAEKIGHVLADEGFQTDVLAADKVKDITGYDGVVIGSAVYIGMWRKEASNFVKKNEKALKEKPVWIFSSGPAEKGAPEELLKGWRVPNGLKEIIQNIEPKSITIFHGDVRPDKMNWLERWMIKNVKSGIGDFRDWDMITRWAKGIAEVLKKQSVAA